MAAAEELDGWFTHSEAKAAIEGWDRSVLRRLNQSSILRQRDGVDVDQLEWQVRDDAVDYIRDKGYTTDG